MSAVARLNPAARTVLTLASAESERLGLPAVGTGQLLVGIVGNGNDSAALILHGLGIDIARTLMVVDDAPERGRHEFDDIRVSGYARKVLDGAAIEADSQNSNPIAPIHILLALLGLPKSSARAALGRMHLTAESLEERLRSMYRPGPTPETLGTAFERISEGLDTQLAGENARQSSNLHVRDIGLRALVAVLNARSLTWRLGHRTVASQHFLFTALEDGSTATHGVLKDMGVRTPDIRLIVKAIERTPDRDSGQLLSGAAQMMLLGAVAEARVLRSPSVETEHVRLCGHPLGRSEVDLDHLILAMTRIDQCLGSFVLRCLGLDSDDVRRGIGLALGRPVKADKPAAGPPGTFWEAVNRETIRRQVSLSQLATRSGISEKLFRQWISGTRRPSSKSCDAIAAAFQIDRNLVRGWAGRPRVAEPIPSTAELDEERRSELLAETRELFDAVEWSEERIVRMNVLLRSMIANDHGPDA